LGSCTHNCTCHGLSELIKHVRMSASDIAVDLGHVIFVTRGCKSNG
jgi:hypothetical protein